MAILEAHSFRIRRDSKRKDPFVPLEKFDGIEDAGTVICDLVKNQADTPLRFPLWSRCMMIGRVSKETDGFSCRARLGEYGKASTLINVTTRTKAYDKKKDDSDLIPHFFHFYFPPGKSTGVVLTERRGHSGIFSLLSGLIKEDFKKNYPGMSLHFYPLMPAAVLHNLLNKGELCEARFKSFKVPDDLASSLLVSGSQDNHEFEVVIRAKGQLRLFPFTQHLNGKFDVTKVLEDHTSVPFDEVRLEIEMGDRRRTVNLENPKRLKATFDIDTTAIEDASGYPKVKELSAEALSLAQSLATALM